ncbi:MAG TPA: hypothetical protein VGV86_12660 [Acidimicrobiales bacterium]|nr:hypothetical protein [Acidimicrobiales bacterium]
MLVLVSFVLVLAAAVTLVVGLLQSGLTLIYLSIACSVLAGVVLAVAVLRGRPEPKAAAPIGRPYTPPASAPPAREPERPVPASVGSPASGSAATPSFTPPPPPPASAPPARPIGDDAATKAAGTALLGRLRGRRGDAPPADADTAPTPVPAPEPEPASDFAASEPVTTEMPAYSAEADDGFPIANYAQLRATELLRELGSLDRNQLEAVREREMAGKNRFTILSRVDVLLAAQAEPAWELDEDEWEADAQAEVDAGNAVIAVGPIADDVDEWDVDDDVTTGEIEDDEAEAVDLDEADEVDVDEVDELVSPVDGPIPGYDSLTVGQILPRLSDLSPDELAQVRAREQAGRGRGTILDRIERLAARSAPAATPAAAPVRKAPATRKARTAAAIPVPPDTSTTAAVKQASTRKAAAAAKAPAPVPAKSPGRRKAAPPVVVSPPAPAPAKRGARKAVVVTPAPAPAPAKSPGRRKAAAPVAPEETSAPTAAAVKKARAKKATKRL